MGDLKPPSLTGNCEPYKCPTCKLTVRYDPCLVCFVRRWTEAEAAGQPLPAMPGYLQEQGVSRRQRTHDGPQNALGQAETDSDTPAAGGQQDES